MPNATTNTRIHQLCFGQPKDTLTIELVSLDELEEDKIRVKNRSN